MPSSLSFLSEPGNTAITLFDPNGRTLLVMWAFYFRAPKIASIVNEMVRSPQMMKRRLREGVEFFQFLRERREAAL